MPNGGLECMAMLTHPPDLVVPIRRGDMRLGRLAIIVNDTAAWSSIRTGLTYAGLQFATILVVSLVTALLALRTAVMRPLMRLHRSIGEAGAGAGWQPVRWSSHDELGDLVAVYNRMIRDVAQREAAQAESEAGLRAIVEAAPYPIVISRRRDSRIMFVNRRTSDVVGLSPEAMIGRYAPNFYVNPDDRARMVQIIAEQGAVLDYEVQSLTGDGRAYWALMSGAFLTYRGEEALFVSFIDISERKRVGEEVARETAILEATLENVAQGIVMVDGECRVVAYNDRYLALTGLPRGLLDGRPRVDDVLRGQGEHGIPFSGLEPLAQESRPAPCGAAGAPTVEQEHVLPGGTALSIVSTALPDGGCVRTFTDITARKEAARQLEQQAQDLAATAVQLETERRRAEAARAAAEDANRAKSDFLATMSHELRTPLNAILGFSEILKDRPFGEMHPDRIADYAGDIHTSGAHLLNLINDVLDLAKIEAGKLEIEPVAIDLEDLLESTTRLVAVRAEHHQLKLRLAVPAPPPALVADERAVKQIAFNLLSNAIKFTSPGGTITVRAEPCPDGGAAIVVADTGCGIPADQIERVMRPFEQAHNSYARSAGGTGLGLALVQALTELHGGRVDLHSAVGVGTTVSVHFPARPAVPQGLPAAASTG